MADGTDSETAAQTPEPRAERIDMFLNRKDLHSTARLLSGILLLLGVGCRGTSLSPQPIAAATEAQTDSAEGASDSWKAQDTLAFFGDEPEGERVPFENRLITNLVQHTTTVHGLDFDPDVYDDEKLLAFASTRNSDRPDVFLKHYDGATLTQLTGDPADDIQPRFSPDGTTIVFCSNRSGNWDLWSVKRDGTGLTQLTFEQTDEVAPCWSPDGSQVAYTRWSPRARQWEVWTLSVSQPGVRKFLSYGMFPAWSPTGGQIAFQRARQRGSKLFSVWTVDLVDGEARRPTEIAHRDEAACIAPRWSPDGMMLIYCTVNGDARVGTAREGAPASADLWVVEVSTGIRMKLTDGGAPAFNPVWASGGRVFFVSPRAGSENIWSLSTELAGYATETAQVTGGDTVLNRSP